MIFAVLSLVLSLLSSRIAKRLLSIHCQCQTQLLTPHSHGVLSQFWFGSQKKHLHQACWQLLVGNEQKLFLNLLFLSLPCCQPSSFSSLSLLRQSQQDFIAEPPRSSFVSKQLFYSCVRSNGQCLFLSEHRQHLMKYGFEMLQVWSLLVHLCPPSGIFCLILGFSGTHQLTQFWDLSQIINNNHLRFYLTTCFKTPTASEHDEEALPYL